MRWVMMLLFKGFTLVVILGIVLLFAQKDQERWPLQLLIALALGAILFFSWAIVIFVKRRWFLALLFVIVALLLAIMAALLFFGGPLTPTLYMGPPPGAVAGFSLRDQSGSAVTDADLRGRAYVAHFIFTRCPQCAIMTGRMAELQRVLPRDVRLISVSVDPDFDTVPVLAEYAAAQSAEPGRWHLLTGDSASVYALLRSSFRVPVDRDTEAASPSAAFVHSFHFILVDADGRIRRYYDGQEPRELKKIRGDAMALLLPPAIVRLPAVNAGLNALCTILLLNGWLLIRRRKIAAHKACMLSAVAVSALFLASYLTFHAYAGSVRFQSQGAVRTVYFAILLTHTILAAAIVPMVLVTLRRAFRGDLGRHASLARVTLPLWLYVSVTGVVIYAMLYHLDAVL